MEAAPLLATGEDSPPNHQQEAAAPAGLTLNSLFASSREGCAPNRAGPPHDIELAISPYNFVDEGHGDSYVVKGNMMVRHKMPRGLRVYNSTSLGDLSETTPVPWGSTVFGVDLGNGWFQASEGYLPMRVDGMKVLTAANGETTPEANAQLHSAFMHRAAGVPLQPSQMDNGPSKRDIRVLEDRQGYSPSLQQRPGFRASRDSTREAAMSTPRGESTLPSRPMTPPKMASAAMSDSDVVQFTAPIYYVEEEEGKLQVDIMRIGNLRGPARCKWETQDASAQAGINYHHGAGEIYFEDGQHSATIEIHIIQSEAWAATLEFKLKLTDAANCELGLFLYMTRVKLIDADYFPTNRYKDQIKLGLPGITTIPQFALIWEFIRMNFDIPGVKWRTFVTILLDQMNNIYLYFTLHVTVYFTDVLFADHPKTVSFIPGEQSGLLVPGSRKSTAVMLGILYCLPMILLHMWDYAKVGMDLTGTVRNYLRANLFRKYLNYSEATRNRVQASDMQAALMEDTRDASSAYINVVEIIRICGRLAIVLTFTFKKNPGSWMILLLMPSLMLGWVRLRGAIYLKACNEEGYVQLEVAKFVHRTCESYTIIAEYMQRPQMNELFYNTLVDATKHGRIPKQQIETNNKYFPKWLGPLFVGIYIATTAEHVVEGTVSIGTFMATVSVLRSIASDFGDVYKVLMEYNVIYGPVVNLVDLFNRPTDVRAGKDANRRRRALTKDERAKAEVESKGRDTEDMIPLKMVELNFQWPGHDPLFSQDLHIEVPQGTCVAVVSNTNAGGRATLLRLIGQRYQPTNGQVFIPTHLRVLHVSNQPLMIEAPIWDNLVFGAKDAPRQRVYQILEDLQMNMTMDAVKSHREDARAEDSEEEDRWQVSFPYSEQAKIHLARAFIMSPEVCVLQRPFSHFSNKTTCDTLMAMIRSMVDNRGVRLPPESRHRRRPRTCFLTPEDDDQANMADFVWTIEDHGIRVDKGKRWSHH